ncbi:hypothetical protein D3C72_2301270 [compost metagenome]
MQPSCPVFSRISKIFGSLLFSSAACLGGNFIKKIMLGNSITTAIIVPIIENPMISSIAHNKLIFMSVLELIYFTVISEVYL